MLLQNERKVSPAQKQVTRYSFVSFRPLQEMLESENHLRVPNSSLNSGGPNGDTQAGLRARARSETRKWIPLYVSLMPHLH